MSTLYNLEPNPTAKVILKTTAGELLLELFANQTPLTSRNFVQLCLDGYYDNTIFHRLVPDFIVQGGDPTGTGSGGQSSYDGGTPFADEFHSRLRFNRRGLLGMANSGSKNDNASQFFLTLGKAEELNGRNTMFGRIEGNTIYNLVKIGEGELVEGEDSDRPMYPTKVIGTEILVNPFEGMTRRIQIAQTSEPSKVDHKKKTKKISAKQMLSFGGDDNDGDEETSFVKAPKYNPKLVQAIRPVEQPSPTVAANLRSEHLKTNVEPREPIIRQTPKVTQPPAKVVERSVHEEDSSSSSSKIDKQGIKLAKTNAKIADLKQSLKREVSSPATSEMKRQKAGLDTMMPLGAKRGVKRLKAGSKDEQDQLKAFAAFKTQLEHAPVDDSTDTAVGAQGEETRDGAENSEDVSSKPSEEEVICDLHFVPNCQSCKRWEEVEEDNGDDDDNPANGSLLGHALTFVKDRMGKDLEWKRQNEKELVVIDPREKEKAILGTRKMSKSRTER